MDNQRMRSNALGLLALGLVFLFLDGLVFVINPDISGTTRGALVVAAVAALVLIMFSLYRLQKDRISRE
jgi:hypothetical protein